MTGVYLGPAFSLGFLPATGTSCYIYAIREKLPIPGCISQTHAEVARPTLCTKPTAPAEAC